MNKSQAPNPKSQILAVDWGLKRVGLAVGEPGGIPKTLPPLVGLKRDQLVSEIKSICKKSGVVKVLLGMPQHRGNAARVKAIGDLIGKNGLEIDYLDETLTSHQAAKELKALGYGKASIKQQIDSQAALLILQEYLTTHS